MTEEDVKKYMVAILPDGNKVLARRVEWVGRTTMVVAHVLAPGSGFCEWKSITGPYDYVYATVAEFLDKNPQFAQLKWERLFKDDKYG